MPQYDMKKGMFSHLQMAKMESCGKRSQMERMVMLEVKQSGSGDCQCGSKIGLLEVNVEKEVPNGCRPP